MECPRVAFSPANPVSGLGLKLRQWLTDIFASAAPAVLTISSGLSYSALIFSGPLTQYLSYGIAATFTAIAIIARAGETADSMLFILNGRVGVTVDAGDGRPTRVRSLGNRTTVGEMGLVARQPRSATIQAEADSVLYVLRADAFNAITASNPQIGQKLLTYFMPVMAERLAFASRMIGALRR